MSLDVTDIAFLSRAKAICASKAAFTTRAEARTFTRRRGFNGHPYRCPWCDHWHMTTYDSARSRAFKRRLSRLMRTTTPA